MLFLGHEFQCQFVEFENGDKGWIPIVADDFKPKVNGWFGSYSEVESMYTLYADRAGFDVRLKAKKLNKDGIIQIRWFVCSKEGIPNKKAFDSLQAGPTVRRCRNSNVKRSGCKACLKIRLAKDKPGYEVYDFVEVHNHCLFDMNTRRYSKSNRKMQYTNYRNILNGASYRMGATKVHRIQTAMKCGFEYTKGSAMDYQNFKRQVGLFVGRKDAKMLINRMSNRRDVNSDYFFEYKCDDKGELLAIFWADEYAQLNYKEFGDVISFDATYRSNE